MAGLRSVGYSSEVRRWVGRHRQLTITATSGLLFLVGWSLELGTTQETVAAVLLVSGAIVGGYDVAKKAYYTLRSGTIGINTLVTLAAIGAIIIGEYWEAAGVVFLFSLGNYLESRTMGKTRAALTELLEMTPDTAVVRREGTEKTVPARTVEEGEHVIIKPGAKVPVDGIVVDGESAIDQAPVTGESTPVFKRATDEVYAGTINKEGALTVKATGTGADTTLQRIIRRVEKAQEAKAPTQTIIERFAKYYTPAIIALAVGTFLLTGNAIMALTLLVIGCPGALVIGPPVSIVSAIGNAARSGVLMKGGEHLETAAQIDVVAFDKTGTLTKGETSVVDVEGFDVSPDEVLQYAAIAEKRSEHHLAAAILDAVKQPPQSPITDGGVLEYSGAGEGVDTAIPDPNEFDVIAGKGVRASYDDHEIVVGNRALLDAASISIPSHVTAHVTKRESAGKTAVYVALDGQVIGVISLSDEVRPVAKEVIRALNAAGVHPVMLTGDNARTARSVAEAVGIDDYRAGLLPDEKQEIIRSFQADGHVVAMVGDGINDAPSLATADVGIAMGAAGTDTAIETADMALMADDLARIPYAVGLSKATRRNVIQNVAIAVGTVLLLLAGVFVGYVHMATGMLVHIGSVLVVILNGMRLLNYQ